MEAGSLEVPDETFDLTVCSPKPRRARPFGGPVTFAVSRFDDPTWEEVRTGYSSRSTPLAAVKATRFPASPW